MSRLSPLVAFKQTHIHSEAPLCWGPLLDIYGTRRLRHHPDGCLLSSPKCWPRREEILWILSHPSPYKLCCLRRLWKFQVYSRLLKKKVPISHFVNFVDDLFSRNRFHSSEIFMCTSLAKFRQEIRTNSCAANKFKQSQNFVKTSWAQRIFLIITSLFFFQR